MSPILGYFFDLHQFYIMLIVPLKKIPSLLTHTISASPYNLLVSDFAGYLQASELSRVLFYSYDASPSMSPPSEIFSSHLFTYRSPGSWSLPPSVLLQQLTWPLPWCSFSQLIYLPVLGLHFYEMTFSSCSERGCSLALVHGLLTALASLVAEHELQGAWAQLPHSMWDLPGSGMEPVSPSLAGEFLTI